jgi:hypothetical protein
MGVKHSYREVCAMLDRLVRPLVRTQIQVLTQNQAASARLTGMVSQWLGYLGVQADVTQLHTSDDKIQIAIAVGKPDQCSDREWQQILQNVNQSCASLTANNLTYQQIPPTQRIKVAHLLALVIQAGEPEIAENWPQFKLRLNTFNLEPSLLTDIQTALKQPHHLDHLLDNLEPEIAAYVLSRAIGIALLDRQINPHEDNMLKAIYNAMT